MNTLRRLAVVATAALGTALTLGPATNALAATPLDTPALPVASTVTTTSITFSWPAVAGPVANYTIQVIDGRLVPWHDLATTSGTTFTHTGLTPDTVYIYRVIANPAAGSGYAASAPSASLYVTSAPLPDSQPPTTPGKPTLQSAGTVGAAIFFDSSTDNNRVAGYWAQRQVNGVWTDWATNNITTIYLRDLAPATSYTVAVVAFDPNGNRSARSAPLTFSTRPTVPAPTCKVTFTLFAPQYLANVSIENMTAATVVENWSMTFTLPVEQTINYSFGATITRTGAVATVIPPSWAIRIGPGSGTAFGFNATYPAGSPLPSGFTLNSAATGPIACS